MAENAILHQNLQNVPSIFEITAAETLDNLIYPALNRVFDFFGLRLDFKLWRGLRLRGEPSPIITWILQYLYLRNRGSSFGESFYGLQRTATKTGEILTPRQQYISATVLTFLPYIERKLKARNAQHEDNSKLEQFCLKLIHIYNASKSIHIFLYLTKYALCHSPLFRTLQLTLRYPAEPIKEDKTSYIFLKSVEVLAFFLQFMQWWYSSDVSRKMGGRLKNPPPMRKIKRNDLPPGICPICLSVFETPTACAISGYVFCFKCIANYVKKHGECPVTGYGISFDDLIRIYEG